MTHLSIHRFILIISLALDISKSPFMYNCSNPIDYPNPRQLTMGLTYATCITKGKPCLNYCKPILIPLNVNSYVYKPCLNPILFCNKDMMLSNIPLNDKVI